MTLSRLPQDGTKVLTASADKTCKVWDLQSNQAIAFAQHAAPVKCIRWVQSPNYQLAITGSWDKTIKVRRCALNRDALSLILPLVKFWDLRTPNPALSLDLPERCYCMDVVSLILGPSLSLCELPFSSWRLDIPSGSGGDRITRPCTLPAGEHTLRIQGRWLLACGFTALASTASTM